MSRDAFAGPHRKRYERMVDLSSLLVGTWNPSGVPPNPDIPQTRDVFSIGDEQPNIEAEDWTVYAVPQQPEQWWFTVSNTQEYELQRSPFWLEVDTGVGPQKQRVDIPYQGIAFHTCAAELRLAFRADNGRFNPEAPPLTFVGRSVAVWARRGRPGASYLTLSTGQNIGFENVVPIPTFTSMIHTGIGGGTGQDRTGVTSFLQGGGPGPFGVSWLSAVIGAIPGSNSGAPSMVAMVVQ